jgi:hypothetical protein
MRRPWLALLATLSLAATATASSAAREVKVLIITGDEVAAHKGRETAPFLKDLLAGAGDTVDVTEAPAKDLTPEHLARYDAFLLNYRNTPQGARDNPASAWSDDNKRAFLDAVRGGKGLVVYHFASAAFTGTSDLDREFEKAVAGGWRKQGFHGKMHEFTVTWGSRSWIARACCSWAGDRAGLQGDRGYEAGPFNDRPRMPPPRTP